MKCARIVLAAALGMLVLACSRDEKLAVRYPADLGIKSAEEATTRLSQDGVFPFGRLAKAGKEEQPTSCKRWQALVDSGYEPQSTLELQAHAGAARYCGLLELVAKAKPAERGFVRDLDWSSPSVVEKLPSSVASEMTPRQRDARHSSMQANKTMKQHDPEAKIQPSESEGPSVFITEGGGLTAIRITVEGFGDFNGDKTDDLVAWVTNGAVQGTWSHSRLVLLTRSSESKALREIASTEVPRFR